MDNTSAPGGVAQQPSGIGGKRSWFRFSLRTLLLAAPLAAILIGVVGTRWYRSYVEMRAVEAIEQLGGTIKRNAEGQIVEVDLPAGFLTDESLEKLAPQLANLATLRTLVLHGPKLSDEGLKPLKQLTQLTRLHLIDIPVTPESIAQLKQDRPHLEVALSKQSPPATALAARKIYDHALLRVAFAPQRGILATGRADGRLEFWDPDRGEVLRSIQAHDEWLFGLAFDPAGRTLATAGGDNVIRLWDLRTARCIRELHGHDDDVHAVAFTPDGRRLASASDDWTVRIWDTASGAELHALRGHSGSIPSLAVSPDGNTVASASRDQTIRLWDVLTGRIKGVLRGHQGDVMSAAFSPDGTQLASGSYDGTVKIWDVFTAVEKTSLRGADEWVFAVQYSPDGRRLAAGAVDGVRVWDLKSGAMASQVADVRLVSSLAFDASGRRLAGTSADGTVSVWDSESMPKRITLGHGYGEPIRSTLAAHD